MTDMNSTIQNEMEKLTLEQKFTENSYFVHGTEQISNSSR